MVTYTWSIQRFDTIPSVNNLTNVINVIHWSLRATKDYDGTEYSTSCAGSITLDLPSDQAFIPYEQVTFNTAVNWIEATLGPVQVSSIQEGLVQSLDSTIDRINNPPFINLPLPWETT